MSETKTYTWVESHNDICALLRQAHDALALTSYPPRRGEWVGLTDEERDNFWKADQMTSKEWEELFDAIETKLKEKNNG